MTSPTRPRFDRGRCVWVHDRSGTYGDWLFKQPLLLGLEQAGWTVRSGVHPFPLLTTRTVTGRQRRPADWDLVLTRLDRQPVDARDAARFRRLVELQRTGRATEVIQYWRRGQCVYRSRTFRAGHEQERIRQLATALGIRYRERPLTVERLTGRVVVLNFAVQERAEVRSQIRWPEVRQLVHWLRRERYTLRVIQPTGSTTGVPAAVSRWFRPDELVETKTFAAARRLVARANVYIGLEAGLAHAAVQAGKIVCSLSTLAHHGPQPLFQTTFRNHLTFFGDQPFAQAISRVLVQLSAPRADRQLARQMNRYLLDGRGLDPDPYANDRKLFSLRLDLLSQDLDLQRSAQHLHARSASIFFTDNLVHHTLSRVAPMAGRLFVDTARCARDLQRLVRRHPQADQLRFAAKPCSFFYGTAMRDGSSDIDLPTLWAPQPIRQRRRLLAGIEGILRRYRLSVVLPHQTPIVTPHRRELRRLRSIVEGGQLTYRPCTQTGEENLQKYEARIKVKLILGEMSNAERQILAVEWRSTAAGRRLEREVVQLERDRRRWPAWARLIRQLTSVTAALGDFGTKGHVLLSIGQPEAAATARAIGGLMRHGILYLVGSRLYTVWNIRRPQHGWFQPITLLVPDVGLFRRTVRLALSEPLYRRGPLQALRQLAHGRLSPRRVLHLLASPQPLIYCEAYRYITNHQEVFRQAIRFSPRQLSAYAREPASNCNTPQDRMLGLWSMATGQPLPFQRRDVRALSKYNFFVQLLTSGGRVDVSETSYYRGQAAMVDSAQNFFRPFRDTMIRLLREYLLYSLARSLPPELLFEKRKEILFLYAVQGRVMLEGPIGQRRQAERFLRRLNLPLALDDGRQLRQLVQSFPQRLAPVASEFFLTWLFREAVPTTRLRHLSRGRSGYHNHVVLPPRHILDQAIDRADA